MMPAFPRLAGGMPRVTRCLALVLAPVISFSAESQPYWAYRSSTQGAIYIALGATREQACTNAVNATSWACDGTEYVEYAQGWKCYFEYYSDYYQACVDRKWFKFASATCTPPEIYDPLTQQCQKVVPPKNDPPPPACGEGDGGGGGPGPGKDTGNPVNLTTGNKYFLETDYNSPGGQALTFGRAWNSYNQKWLFSFRQHAEILETGGEDFVHTVNIYRENGRVVSFYRTQGGPWRSDPDIRDTIAADNTGWLYTHSSGRKEWYDSTGKLIRIEYTDGGAVDLVYNGTLVTVADEYGNALTLTLDAQAGRVIAMTDPDGEEYRYFYNDVGNLEHVSYPDGTSGPGSNPFGEDNPYRTYYYTDPNNSNLVTAIVDENRDPYKAVSYDAAGRAIASGLGLLGSLEPDTLDYTHIDNVTDPRVTVTNALGRDTIYHLEHHYGVTDIKTVDGMPWGTCAADTLGRTYYAANGWPETTTDKAGVVTRLTYYTDTGRYGLVATRTEAKGSLDERVFTYDWDSATRQKTYEKLAAKVDGSLTDLRETDWVYDPVSRRLQSRTDTDLTTDTTSYPSNGRTRVWRYAYEYHDAPGTQLKNMTVTDPRGNPTTYEYSTNGFLTRTTNALGDVTQYGDHNGRGQPGKIIDPNGTETLLAYTPRGWLDSITRDSGGENAVTDFTYDAVGQLKKIAQPNNAFLTFDYNAARRLQAIENNAGERVEYVLDALGNPADELVMSDTGGIERAASHVFDALGRLHRVEGSYGQYTQYDYGSDGYPSIVTDALGRTSIPGFDDLGRMVALRGADNETTTINYDGEDRVTLVADQRALETRYTYDGFGNLKQVANPDTGITRYKYDDAGNRTEMTDARGIVTNYSYDALNRLKTITYPAHPAGNVTYSYGNWSAYNIPTCTTCTGRLGVVDDLSGTTGYVYDAHGNPVTVYSGVDGVTYPVSYGYDAADKLESITYPSGRTVDYTLDALGRISGITTRPNAAGPAVAVVSSVAYEPFGPVKSFTYGSGLKHVIARDMDGRVEAIATRDAGSDVQDVEYEYDLADNIETILDALEPSNDQAFDYDALDRLASAVGLYGARGYTYDPAGNRLSQTLDDGAGVITETYTVDAGSNRLLTVTGMQGNQRRTFTFTDTGNVAMDATSPGFKASFIYNDANRLVQVTNQGVTANYTYNAFGQRVRKQLSGGVVNVVEQYIYDLEGNLIAVLDGTGRVIQEYIYLNGIAVALLADEDKEPVDSDGDGVTDGMDNCPITRNPGQDDGDNDGIGNVCDVPPSGC